MMQWSFFLFCLVVTYAAGRMHEKWYQDEEEEDPGLEPVERMEFSEFFFCEDNGTVSWNYHIYRIKGLRDDSNPVFRCNTMEEAKRLMQRLDEWEIKRLLKLPDQPEEGSGV